MEAHSAAVHGLGELTDSLAQLQSLLNLVTRAPHGHPHAIDGGSLSDGADVAAVLQVGHTGIPHMKLAFCHHRTSN